MKKRDLTDMSVEELKTYSAECNAKADWWNKVALIALCVAVAAQLIPLILTILYYLFVWLV